MKITVELPEEEMMEICELSGTQKKGPAIRILLDDALQLRRRSKISQKFLTGEWSSELDGYEVAKAAEKQSARTLAEQWRD
ncbi:MAG: hypothetical protein LAT83_10900 [Kiritimatiellae bacterium]|nr:hypothetical protein [Kiritimatiellia bacterium]